MSLAAIVLPAAILVWVIYCVMTHNRLVTVKHTVAKAWANIDVLLKQRHDELPKLVETCKQYVQFDSARSGGATGLYE